MTDDKDSVFTAENLADALNELGQMAHDAGRVIDIAIYGGSCLMLVSNFRVATADVDAVAAHVGIEAFDHLQLAAPNIRRAPAYACAKPPSTNSSTPVM